MAVNTVNTLQERVTRATDKPTQHDPTWINTDEIISVNLDILSVDDTDYPFPIEFWEQSGEEISSALTQHRCFRQSKRQYENGGMKSTKARVEEIRQKYQYRHDDSFTDNR